MDRSIVSKDDKDISFKRGIDFQREKFKSAKDGSGENNFDLMCDSIENIKSEIKVKIEKSNPENGDKIIKSITDRIDWYRNKEKNYMTKTPGGYAVQFPPDIHIKANKILTKAYEILIKELDKLDLL